MIEKYSLGFAFNKEMDHVALIYKNRPEWQKDKFNGIGGHKEENETFLQCMIREFEEETGYRKSGWNNFLSMVFPEAIVECYFTILPLENLRTQTDERIYRILVSDIIKGEIKCIPNLKWIIPMILSFKEEPIVKYMVKHSMTI